MALEPRIEAIRLKYELNQSDFWQIQQNGQWVCKHAALEVVAVKAGVEWFPPTVIEARSSELITSMVVTGRMGDRTEWATGETGPTNYSVKGKQPAYPWAMSEKRAKDRVILKLIGIHGLVYSEDESDSFQESAPKFVESEPKAKSRDDFRVIMDALREAGNTGRSALRDFWTSKNFIEAYELQPPDFQKELTAEKDAFLASYPKPTVKVDPNTSLDSQFNETMRGK